ncbi:hypothetical protein Gogos_001359 [Gossypium gossypioides]|uniref:Uncharacterized protein n=1 Tax=Gossypium gossypioides TaxID=34282 RepID=A0A7J9CVW6_GOSGO|nr:hypothetical protein [Gossypium gossypioides]
MPSCLYPTYVTRAVGFADSTSKRSPDLRSDRHISFCNKFRATKQSTPSLPWGESLVEASNHRELVLLHGFRGVKGIVSFSNSRVVSQLFLAELFFSSLKGKKRKHKGNLLQCVVYR